MAKDYSRREVLGIIESEAHERNIPREDFLRFAYIETGGTFDELVSRGPNGAKGLFQFIPSTARGYGIEGRELDAVANTDAAARLYLDNRRIIVNSHEQTGRPYLSSRPVPDGLDMYLAHQQGADGYRSVQSALATGIFARQDTRENILRNVSGRDLHTLVGMDKTHFSRLSDKEMASAFVDYWQQKYDRIRIPEMQVEPRLDRAGAAQTSVAPAPAAQSSPQAAVSPAPITLSKPYAETVANDHLTYVFSSKSVNNAGIDCSGWVVHLQNATMKEINLKAGRTIFDKSEMFSPGYDAAAMIVDKAVKRSGVLIEGKNVTKDVLKEGMVIGEDNGDKGWERGRYKGIDHIVMVVRDPKNGELMISQSRKGEGVELTSVDRYLDSKHARNVKLFATDPLAEARDLLQSKEQVKEQIKAEKQVPGMTAAEVGAAVGAKFAGAASAATASHGMTDTQEKLNALGYTGIDGKPLKSDGSLGPNTRAAVEAFQREHGLKDDGKVGPLTLGKLDEAIQAQSQAPRHGTCGPGVEKLQEQLNRAGIETSVNGDFNHRMSGALKDYQQAHDLPVTGLADARTMARLGQQPTNSQSQTESPLRIDQKGHPGNPLYVQAQGCMNELCKEYGKAPDARDAQAAGALAAAAREKGMTGVDRIVLSDDRNQMFAMQGDAASPSMRFASMPTMEALGQPLEKSTVQYEQAQQGQQKAQEQQQQQQTQNQAGPAR